MALSEQEVFVLSERTLSNVIDHIQDHQWDQTTPDWFQTGRQDKPTLREIVNYHAYDTAWVPAVLAGKTIADVGSTFDGDLLGNDAKGSYRRYSEQAIAAALGLKDPEKMVHLSYGDYPAREYFKHITSFRGFRAYDIAQWIGIDTALPPELVQGLWDELLPEIETWRQIGVFGPPVAVPDDAPLQDRLLGMVGRDPKPLAG